MPTIITNKHVVRGSVTGKLKVHLADQHASGQLPSDICEEVALSNFEQQFFMHPDPHVDLCAMPFQPLHAEALKEGKVIYHKAFDDSLIPTQEQLDNLTTVENVLMIGYPNGLWDEINNLPLFRRGITASHPAIDFNGKSVTVIDAACFPGSSGSPVILYDSGTYTDKSGGTTIGSRMMLLGVLRAGPQITAQGNIVIQDIPTTRVPMAATPVMMHLGYIIKAKEITSLGKAMIETLQQMGRLA